VCKDHYPYVQGTPCAAHSQSSLALKQTQVLLKNKDSIPSNPTFHKVSHQTIQHLGHTTHRHSRVGGNPVWLGPNKNHSFPLLANQPCADMIITKSPIDTLSVAVMEQLKFKEGYFRSHKIATCGHPKSELK